MITIQFAGQQEVEKAFEMLEVLIDDAENAENVILDRMSQIKDLDNRIIAVTKSKERMEADLIKEITDQVGEDGKKLFTNAEARKAELSKRMENNESNSELAKLTQEKIDLEMTIKQQETTLKNIRRRENFYHARIAFGTAILNAIK